MGIGCVAVVGNSLSLFYRVVDGFGAAPAWGGFVVWLRITRMARKRETAPSARSAPSVAETVSTSHGCGWVFEWPSRSKRPRSSVLIFIVPNVPTVRRAVARTHQPMACFKTDRCGFLCVQAGHNLSLPDKLTTSQDKDGTLGGHSSVRSVGGHGA